MILSSWLRQAYRRSSGASLEFVAGQYNILAGYLGNNTEPWFLYGPEVCKDRRAQIKRLHVERTPDGKLVNAGWPNYVRGILSPAEQVEVEQVHEEHFSWERRKHRIIEVIRGMDADVPSMVELDHYQTFFKPELDNLGYDAVWCKRPRNTSHDGCCIAWRRSAFELVSHTWVEYSDSFEHEGLKVVKKDRVALLALLQSTHTGDKLCVVSTHLARCPEEACLDMLRCRQVGQVIRNLGSFVTEHGATDAPVLLLGDMNATSIRRLLGMASAALLLRRGDTYLHPFMFECVDVPSGPTSVTTARSERLDAILYQKSCLDLVSVKPLPTLSRLDPIPNKEHPSDHVPVVATFRVCSEANVARYWAREWFLEVAGLRGGSMPLSADQLARAFRFYDHGCDGYITSEELRLSVTLLLGPDDLGHSEITLVLSKLRFNPHVSLGTFVSAYSVSAAARSGMPGLEHLEEAFHAFDLNGDGALNAEEVQMVFSDCCPTEAPDAEAIASIFRHMDQSKDGLISMEEFLRFLNEAWRSQISNCSRLDYGRFQ